MQITAPQHVPGLPYPEIILGTSKAMHDLQEQVEKAARTKLPVLVTGEIGTGKGLVARLVHCCSRCSAGPWLRINCAAMVGAEFERYILNNLTNPGAIATNRGLQWGTVFFSQISELDAIGQERMLQLLARSGVMHLDALPDVAMRVVCSSARNLAVEAEAGRFRKDLHHCLSAFEIRTPSLRQRVEDVPELADYFVHFYAWKHRLPAIPLSTDLVCLLLAYDWPGNLLELSSLMLRLVLLGNEEWIKQELRRTARPVIRGDYLSRSA